MPSPRKKLLILLGIAIIMIDGFDLQAIGFVAPEMARDWSVPIADFGPVFSAGLIGSMLGAVLAGTGTRLLGGRAVLASALVLFGSCTLASAWARNLSSLTTLRFLVGIGVGAAVPVVMSVVARNSPAHLRATLLVLTACGQPAGAILGAMLCAHFIPIQGWPFAFYLGGTIPLLLACIVLPLKAFNSPTTPAAPLDPARDGRIRDLFGGDLLAMTALLWVCCFLSVFFVYIVLNWLPSAVRTGGYSLEQSVFAVSLFNSGGIAGALTIGALIDRYGPWKILPHAFGLAALSMALLALSRAAPPFLVPVSFAAGFSGYGAVMSLGALILLLYPRALHTMGVGWALGVGRLGAAVGPLSAGFALGAGLAVGNLFYFAAVAALFVMLCLLALAQTRSGAALNGSGSA